MTYVTLFLPSIFALTAFLMTLKFGVNKTGLIIGAVTVMAVFLYVNDKYPVYYGVNTMVLSFAAVYLAVFTYNKLMQKKRSKMKPND